MAERDDTLQKILDELRAGVRKEENYRLLFMRYYGAISHFFAKRGFPPEDCLDLTQETFLGILQGVDSFRGDAPFEAWLFNIAANVYRKRLRWQAATKRDGREVALDRAEEITTEGYDDRHRASLSHSSSPHEEVLSKERSRSLNAAVATLPRKMRNCLILRLYYDLKYKEIAQILRVSIETVKVHLHQARKRLRKQLGDGFGELHS